MKRTSILRVLNKNMKLTAKQKREADFFDSEYSDSYDSFAEQELKSELKSGNVRSEELDNIVSEQKLLVTKEDNECSVTDKQKGLIQDPLVLSKEHILFGNHTAILFINSVFYTSDADGMISCYNSIFDTDFKKVQEIVDSEYQRLMKDVELVKSSSKDIKNIMVVAHEPIYSLKKKDDPKKSKKQYIPLNHDGIKLLSDIYNLLGKDIK